MAVLTHIIMSSAKISNEKNVTPEQVVEEATEMWKKCRARFAAGLKLGDTDGANDLMAQLRREHKEFCTSYPIVMRYMAELQTFTPKALSKYLMKIAERPWTTEDEYIESQVDYVVILYRETNPRWDTKKVSSVRAAVHSALKKERDAIKKLSEEVTAAVEEKERQLMDKSRADLREWLVKQKAAAIEPATLGTIDVSADSTCDRM